MLYSVAENNAVCKLAFTLLILCENTYFLIVKITVNFIRKLNCKQLFVT